MVRIITTTLLVVALAGLSWTAEISQTAAPDIASCLENQGLKSNQIVLRDRKETQDQYDVLNYQWSIFYPIKYPMMYVLPENSKDVQKIIYCSRLYNTRAVPKSGGHSFAKYAYGDSKSLVMDFQNFTAISIDKQANIVHVDPGIRIGKLAVQLAAKNYIFPVGLCPAVGIGITLGGGYVAHVRKYGIMSDSLSEVELVTPSASLLIANNETNQDLFWAIRGAGAGGAFGIVTKYTFKLRAAPYKYISSQKSYTPSTSMLTEVLTAFMAYMDANIPDWPTIEVVIRTKSIDVAIRETVTEDELKFAKTEAALNMFPVTDNVSIAIQNFSDFLATNLAHFEQYDSSLMDKQPVRVQTDETTTSYSDTVFYNDIPVVNKVTAFITDKILNATEIEELGNTILEMPNDFMFVEFLPMGGAISHFKPTDNAFVHRKPKQYKVAAHYFRPSMEKRKGNCALAESGNSKENYCKPLTTDPTDLRTSLAYLDKFFNFTMDIFQHNETYQNDLDEETPNFLERYFGENLPRLKEIKKKFDPENYFHNPQSIPPAD